MSDFGDCVAREILAEMARQSMRQGELARRLGWSRPTLARRLAGVASFTLADVERIAGVLGIPLERLISPEQAVCGYCERAMWRDGLEPCCDLPEHAGHLVCQDSHGCMGVILLRLHDREHVAGGPTIPGHEFVRPGQVDPQLPPPDNCMRCGLPETAHRSAELAARRIAAAVVLADFRRWLDGEIVQHDWQDWSRRLALAVESLLSEPEPSFDVAAGADPLAIPANRIGAPDSLTGLGERAILRLVLADAIAFREPQGICPDCDGHPAGLCEDHSADLDRTDDYLALARHLGLELDR